MVAMRKLHAEAFMFDHSVSSEAWWGKSNAVDERPMQVNVGRDRMAEAPEMLRTQGGDEIMARLCWREGIAMAGIRMERSWKTKAV